MSYQQIQFEKDVCDCLKRIELFGDPLDIKFVEIKIGEYRLYAYKNNGFIKYAVHQHANALEHYLENILEKRKNGNI